MTPCFTVNRKTNQWYW